jgi:uncharacterized membrane-anchored protein YitT (DUF2179 family)
MTQYVQEKVAKMENPVVAWVLVSLILMLACVYAYFVNGTIQNIVEAKGLRTKISAVTSLNGSREAEYLAAKSSVDLTYAQTLGMISGEESTVYITKKSDSSISFNR